ncbi:Helicase conserved C-terminal domain-containing protein [Haloarcula vallismortis]|uniref:Helicase n=2 Tax=Haloarcula vallismortis TaxID=28442 RepID=M0JK57_HALVA|nr:SNF2-related protein [Haloarcula vallismortis]EMA08733.1 helicase [Haloarcula vallismortis ATCC 29715]SDX21619.1 Helicase conserved C-terminal domain-containing protein [Haloarcula vallismortis]
MDDEDLVDVEIAHEAPDDISDAYTSEASEFPFHRLTVVANRLSAGQPDTELRSLSSVDEEQVKLLEHQVDAAHRALFEMDGKALLADEVGLGKTIEVGMILKEMHYRETDDSVLILTPAQLAKQWQGELREKFGLDFVCNYDGEFQGFDAHDRIISSIDTAKSDRYRHSVLSRNWDVLVLDEAHYVKNEDTDRYELIDKLTYDYAFFLTATPIQNELTDLYNIVSLLRPGLFGSRETFHHYFVDNGQDTLVNRNELQQRLHQVMIRNRRAETDIDFTNREIDTRTFQPSNSERELYEAVTDYVREAYSEDRGQKLVLMMLQKEVVSSPAALKKTIRKQLDANNELTHRSELETILEKIDAIETVTKQERLFDIVEEAREHVEMGRVIVFTQFRATQQQVLESLQEQGYTTHAFHGGHSSQEKEDIVDRFREEGGVLVSTDAMSEGRNLQFCNIMVNYDLPWNPMKVEQRIGRIHRIGQKREVFVFNMALEDTIEEYVLERLYHKIDLFQQTVGELSTILTRLEDSGKGFEDEIFERLVNADSDANLENDFEAMAVDLEEQQELSEKVENFNSAVFENFDLGATDD